jgi:putative ABC transport system substrate-binding protein
MLDMKRRQFITLLGGAAVPWPLAAWAQQPVKIYRIGFLTAGSGGSPLQQEFAAALGALGYQENRNVLIERRYAAGDLTRLVDLAHDLVRAGVDVIVTEATPAAVAAKEATARIPIVMATSGDPVASGLIASLARPGGNVTGSATLSPELDRKRLELLRELVPSARRIAFFGNNLNSGEQIGFRGIQAAAAEIGIEAIFINATLPATFEMAFTTMTSRGADVAVVSPTPTNIEALSQIVGSATRYRLPAVYGTREFADAGGLISYGANRLALSRRAATFVDRILKGAAPANLPVEQPTKFDLVVNVKAAKAIGLDIPLTLTARADEVIE